jgi:hypothetical protein
MSKTTEAVDVVEDVAYMPLSTFADSYATKYGIELMGGFYYEQELKKKYADTEENWHKAIDTFSKKEVK